MGRRGTGGYRAPELHADHPTYTTASDMWGLGCILYELVTGKRVFQEDWNTIEFARKGEPFSFPSMPFDPHTNTLLGSLISALLSLDPTKRPSAEMIRAQGTTAIPFSDFWGTKFSPGFGVRRFMIEPRENSLISTVNKEEVMDIGYFKLQCFSHMNEVFSPKFASLRLVATSSACGNEFNRTAIQTSSASRPQYHF
jgi:serine/threonine protein kinase